MNPVHQDMVYYYDVFDNPEVKARLREALKGSCGASKPERKIEEGMNAIVSDLPW